MRKKLLGFLSVAAIAGGVFAFISKSSECPLEGPVDCPSVKECALQGTSECPIRSESSDLLECCKKN